MCPFSESALGTGVFASCPTQERAALNRVGETINLAMQQKLVRADEILRTILRSGDLKVMEATLRKHLRAGEIDMAFDVMLNVNIQQALDTETDAAARILQHLRTVLMEVSWPPFWRLSGWGPRVPLPPAGEGEDASGACSAATNAAADGV
jgi:hypothetical protein